MWALIYFKFYIKVERNHEMIGLVPHISFSIMFLPIPECNIREQGATPFGNQTLHCASEQNLQVGVLF